MFYIPQIKNDDCGFACVKMLLADHFNNKDYLFIPNTQDGAYSYKNLMSVSKEYGLILQGIKVEDKEEIKKFDKFPAIVTLVKDDASHAVVITKIRFGYIYINDPASGTYSMSVNKFIELWDGTMLIKEKEEASNKIPEQFNFVSSSSKIKLIIFQVLAALTLMAAIYFFKDDTNVVFIILIAAFALFEGLLYFSQFKVMKEIDFAFKSYLDDKNIQNKSLLPDYEIYKKEELTNVTSTIFAFAISFLLIVMAIVNNYYNALFILITFIIAVIKVGMFNPKMDEMKSTLFNKEIALSDKKLDDYKDNLDAIHSKSYYIGKYNLLFKCISLVLIIVSVYMTMQLNEIFSTSFVLFYTVLSLYLLEQLESLLGFSKNKSKYYESKIKLINSLKQNHKKDR